MQHLEIKLETVFRDIEIHRMQGMPVCNPVLKVKAIGFQQWGEYYFGVMMTPWFMNLMLIPRDPALTIQDSPGSKSRHAFPSGHFEFVHAKEEALGHFQVCSLFSPMFEFADQETAISTALEVIAGIMETQDLGEKEKSHENQENPINRRQFLRTLLTATGDTGDGN